MVRKINRLDSLELVMTLIELAQRALARGDTIEGMTNEEVRNWTFRRCPVCHIWSDGVVFCSEDCEDIATHTFHDLRK